MPRHPPCALLHLTKSVYLCALHRISSLLFVNLTLSESSFFSLVFSVNLRNCILISQNPRLSWKTLVFRFRGIRCFLPCGNAVRSRKASVFISISFSLLTCLYTKYIYSVFKVLTLSGWWRIRGSNPWPPACKAGALPAELIPHKTHSARFSSSLERRWSSRSFSNGYLVTTSPQSLVLP